MIQATKNRLRTAVGLLAVAAVFMTPMSVAQAHTLAVGSASGSPGAEVTIPFTWTKTSNVNLAGQFDLLFDSSQLEFTGVALGPVYESASGASISTGSATGGVTVIFFNQSQNFVVENGTLLTATFKVRPAATTTSNSLTIASGLFSDNTGGANADISSQVTVTAGAVTLPAPPTVASVAFSPTALTGQAPQNVTVTVTFSEAVTASPAPIMSLAKTPSSTGSAPGPVTLSPQGGGSSATVYTGTFSVNHLSNGTLTASFTATDVNDSLALATQPTSGNTLAVNLTPPPDSVAPTATIAVSPSTVTAAGNVTITLTVADNNTPVVASTPTISITGPLAAVNVTNQAMTAGANNTFTFTRAIPSQAGVNGTYDIAITATDAASNPLTAANISGPKSFTVAITGLPSVTANASAGSTSRAPGTIALDASSSTFTGTDVTGVTYSWSQTSGPAEASPGIFSSTRTAPKAFFNAKSAGTYAFRVVVTSAGATPSVSAAKDLSVAILDLAPVIVTQNPVIKRLPATGTTDITLNASDSFDPNGDTITYSWSTGISTTSAVLTNNTSAAATLTVQSGITQVDSIVNLTATANSNSTSAAIQVIAATTAPPRASAGVDQSITTTGATVQVKLYGRDSYAPSNPTAAAATALNFAWTLEGYVNTSGVQSAGSATFSNAAAVDPTVTISAAGIYTFKLVVTTRDSAALSAEARVRVRLSRIVAGGGVARGTISVSASDASLVTSAASIAAGRITTVVAATAQPTANAQFTFTGSASGGGAGIVTYRWAVYDPTRQNQIQLTNSTGATTGFIATANQAGTADIILQVARGGVQGLPARIRLNLARTNNSAPTITVANATSGGVKVSGATTQPARITAGGVSPTIRINVTATDAQTAAGSLTYTVTQLIQSEISAQLTALGIDPTNPALGNTGGTTPRLEAFAAGSQTATFAAGSATLDFNLRPVGATADTEAIGGAYVFAITVSDASGATAQKIVTVNVIDLRVGGRGLLNLSVNGANASEGAEGTVYQVATNLTSSGQLVLDLTGTTDFRTGFRVSISDGTPTTTFAGFIRWDQASGPTDFSAALSEANLSNNGRGSFKLTLSPAGAGDYVFKTTFDNGDAQSSSTLAATASPAAAATGGAASSGSSSGGGLCAMGGAGNASRTADLLMLLLPFGLLLTRRRSSGLDLQ